MFQNILSRLKGIKNLNIIENEPMSRHTTFKIGGPARLFVEASDIKALKDTLIILANADICPFILGNGSNLLVSDDGFNGVILKNSCKNITVSRNTVFAESGALLSTVANTALRSSLTGLEFAHGIPGTVGGALVMNAGAYGGEISQVLKRATYFYNGETFTISGNGHNFGYRESIYKKHPEFTILSAEFELTGGDSEKISERMHDLACRRREKQPLEFPSAGSTFKRPEGHFAGALIEESKLKGYSIGGAEVSEKHAGFIINRGNATAEDVRRLIDHIKETVYRDHGIMLECEICFIGGGN